MLTLSHEEQVKRHFNKANKTYDQYGELQHSTGEKLISLINLNQTNHIIDLGCGTGITTKKLANAFSYQTFHALDIANELLKKTKQLLPDIYIHNVSFDHLPHHTFDLIFSNMALQWSLDLSQTLQIIKSRINANGMLAFSIPLIGTLSELKHNYSLNNFLSATEIQEKLKQCNLKILTQQSETISLHFDSLFTALKSIKNVGASYTGRKRHKGLRGKKLLMMPMAQNLTYVVGYFIAKRDS